MRFNFDRLKRKNRGIVVSEYSLSKNFVGFVDKFGRRLFIDDAVDRLFGEPDKRWKIDGKLLDSGNKLFREDKNKFKEAVNKARDKKEFLWLVGIR